MSQLTTPSTGNAAVDDLVAYYRFRIDEFEKERELHLARLDMVEPQKEELHRLRWEAKNLDAELLSLRKTVSDAQITVHRERETSNDQTAHIVRLKAQQVEDRKRIQRLLALTQPVVSDITFLSPGSEGAGEQLAHQYRAALENAESEVAKSHSDGILSAQAVASRLQARNESLQMTIDSLKDQLGSYKSIARDKISSLYEDRNIREQQFAKTTENLSSRVELLTKKLNATEDNLQAVTKDYLVLRHNAQVAQRVMVEEKQLLKAERGALESDRQSTARQMSLEMEAARQASQAEIELATSDFRGQVQARERDMAVLREQYENIQGVYESRVRDLSQQVEHYRSKFANVNRRRKLEIQGAAAASQAHRQEVEGLKRQLAHSARLQARGPKGVSLRDSEALQSFIASNQRDDGSSAVDLVEEEYDDEEVEADDDTEEEEEEEEMGKKEEIKALKGRILDMEDQIRRLIELRSSERD